MRLILMILVMVLSLESSAGPRVVGNGFLPEKEKTIVDLETEYKKAKNNDQRFGVLNQIVQKYASESYTIKNENIPKIKRMALALITLANNYKTSWDYGNAIHHGNLALGRVALFNNNIQTAEEFLSHACKSKSSPQLKSFGPNMTLAKELLKKDKKQPVLSYIDDCLKIWTDRTDVEAVTSEWKKTIGQGEIPDFGANLEY